MPTDMIVRRWSGVWLACALTVAGCRIPDDEGKQIEPVYDPTTGRLQLLRYDANGDGRVDTWSYMDGTRAVRIEIDTDHDQTVDRWEYYGADERIERVGSSRLNDGTPDSWAFYAGDGSLTRVEFSMKRTQIVDRIEYYVNGAVVRAEEDTNGDGRIDKWESYDGRRLAAVSFDTTYRGTPDRRLVYGPDGAARLELLPAEAPTQP